MKGKLDPNDPEQLEIIKEILDVQDVSYRVVVLLDNQIVKNLSRDLSVDLEQAAFEANFWQQVYFDYSDTLD